MTEISDNEALLIMWLTFTGVASLGVMGILLWAVRSRQFGDQQRARHLALMSGIPNATTKESANPGDSHVSA